MMEREYFFKVKELQCGQVAPYKDSIYEFEIETDAKEYTVKEFCQSFLKRSKNQVEGGCFNGSCQFPFGLDSYFKFTKRDDGKYHYIVCSPYTG